jgi:hypothetical protein
MVAFAVNCDIRLWESSIEPISESIAISDKCHLEAPFLPIGFVSIKAEICRPGSFKYELHSEEWVTGSRRGNGRQLGSLSGCHSRHVRTRA